MRYSDSLSRYVYLCQCRCLSMSLCVQFSSGISHDICVSTFESDSFYVSVFIYECLCVINMATCTQLEDESGRYIQFCLCSTRNQTTACLPDQYYAAIVCNALFPSQDEGNENSFVFRFSSCPYLVGQNIYKPRSSPFCSSVVIKINKLTSTSHHMYSIVLVKQSESVA